MGSSPNGLNINEGVGSTHPEGLAKFVLEKGAHVRIAFDGDGDRLIAVDEKGQYCRWRSNYVYLCKTFKYRRPFK